MSSRPLNDACHQLQESQRNQTRQTLLMEPRCNPRRGTRAIVAIFPPICQPLFQLHTIVSLNIHMHTEHNNDSYSQMQKNPCISGIAMYFLLPRDRVRPTNCGVLLNIFVNQRTTGLYQHTLQYTDLAVHFNTFQP